MFTGIVEEVGTVRRMQRQGNTVVLEIEAERVIEDIHLGDSISVNGTCLTVTDFNERTFQMDAVPETIRKTSLQELGAGSFVNLERAMAAGGRFGGHFVTGHIDGTGSILDLQSEERAVIVTVGVDASLIPYMVDQGSVAIDGISLTINEVEADRFRVSIIPHTWNETVLRRKKAGDRVNIECDMLAKYVAKMLGYDKDTKKENITETFLAENGFM